MIDVAEIPRFNLLAALTSMMTHCSHFLDHIILSGRRKTSNIHFFEHHIFIMCVVPLYLVIKSYILYFEDYIRGCNGLVMNSKKRSCFCHFMPIYLPAAYQI